MLSFIKKLFGKKEQQKVVIKEITPKSEVKKSIKKEYVPSKSFDDSSEKSEFKKEKIHQPKGARQDSSESTQRQSRPPRPERKPRAERPLEQKRETAKREPVTRKLKESVAWNPEEFVVAPEEGKTRFHDLGLSNDLLHGIYDSGFQYATPIQSEVLPLEFKGRDLIGKAQTGTGKTAAFLINIIRKFQDEPKECSVAGKPRALIFAPTRELALQIVKDADTLTKYINFNTVAIFGGMDYTKQLDQLENEIADIVVATPGRLLDFIRRKNIDLSGVDTLVIDEADRMLDMGFIPDLRQIMMKVPEKGRQTMLFSATISDEVLRLADKWSKDHHFVEIESESITVDTIDQYAYMVSSDDKYSLLYNLLITEESDRVIIFCNRRDEAKHLHGRLEGNDISCDILSGDLTQKKRISTLDKFKEGKIKVLVATDVAARGIHIDGVSNVYNYTLPDDPEIYVHRIGRTGRAGTLGKSAILACEETSYNLPALEEFIGKKITFLNPEPELLIPAPPSRYKPAKRPRPIKHRPPRPHHGGAPHRRKKD